MSYTIKHIRLNENNPFKKVVSKPRDKESKATKLANDVMIKQLSEELSEYYKNNIRDDFNTAYKSYADIAGLNYNTAINDLNSIFSFFKSDDSDEFLSDIDIKIFNGTATILVPCLLAFRMYCMYIFDVEMPTTSLYLKVNGFFKYLFTNSDYGYYSIIKKYIPNISNIDVKMNVLSTYYCNDNPKFVFSNIQSSVELINVYKTYFLDMFYEPMRSPVISKTLRNLVTHSISFINCFVDSKDLCDIREFLETYVYTSKINYIFISSLALSFDEKYSLEKYYLSQARINSTTIKIKPCVHPKFDDAYNLYEMLNTISKKHTNIIVNVVLFGKRINEIDTMKNGKYVSRLEKFGFSNNLFKPLKDDIVKKFNMLMDDSYGANLGYLDTCDNPSVASDDIKDSIVKMMNYKTKNKTFYDQCIASADQTITTNILKKKYNSFIKKISFFLSTTGIDINYGFNEIPLWYFIGYDNYDKIY